MCWNLRIIQNVNKKMHMHMNFEKLSDRIVDVIETITFKCVRDNVNFFFLTMK